MNLKTQILSPYVVALQKKPSNIENLCVVSFLCSRLVWLKTLSFLVVDLNNNGFKNAIV